MKTTNPLRKALCLLVIFAAALAGAVHAQSEYEWIVIRPNLDPVRVAVPDFKALTEGAGNAPADLTRLLREAIAFTGLFALVDPGRYPDPVFASAKEEFGPWEAAGAQFLIKGTVACLSDGRYQVEIRCYDVKLGQLILGKRYTGEPDLFNRIILRFVDELLGWLQPSAGMGALDARIAYVTDKSRRKEIHVMDTDGSHDKAVTSNRTLNLLPAWAPQGHYIIYTGYQNRNPDIFLADLDEGRQWKIFGERGLNLAGEFSPDGKLISFSREGADGNVDIYVMGIDGRNLKRLTTSPSIEVGPTWSPDGRLLAFVSDRAGSPQIYLLDLSRGMESPGNPAVKLTTEGSYNTSPAWSKDGRYIAYTGRVGGQFDLFLLDMSGSRERVKRLTATRANEEHPSWSPDSRFLVFESNKHGNYDLFITSIYGGEPKRITDGKANEKMPDWSPRI